MIVHLTHQTVRNPPLQSCNFGTGQSRTVRFWSLHVNRSQLRKEFFHRCIKKCWNLPEGKNASCRAFGQNAGRSFGRPDKDRGSDATVLVLISGLEDSQHIFRYGVGNGHLVLPSLNVYDDNLLELIFGTTFLCSSSS